MEHMTVKETARRWGVSIRTVNMYLNEGRVAGAIRKDHGWLVPQDAQKPADRRRRRSGAGTAQGVQKSFMPILSLTHTEGKFIEALSTLEDEEERSMALAGRHYFRGEASQARVIAEQFFFSKSADIRLSARWLHAMASIACGEAEVCGADFAEIQREGECACDERIRIHSQFIAMLAKVYFHKESADMSSMMRHVERFPDGVRYFVLYGRAHELYLHRQYRQSVGVVESALALMREPYPVAAIYLGIVGAMASISLALSQEAQEFFDCAWKIATPERYFEPFAEHHGLLQGLIERKIRASQPELYQKICEMVYCFSRGWMKIHNSDSKSKVTDLLTPYEFSIAMLAAKVRTNKEIAEYMSVSINSVKAYLATIYQKLGITKRAQLLSYVNY